MLSCKEKGVFSECNVCVGIGNFLDVVCPHSSIKVFLILLNVLLNSLQRLARPQGGKGEGRIYLKYFPRLAYQFIARPFLFQW